MKSNIKTEAIELQNSLVNDVTLENKDYYTNEVLIKQKGILYDKGLQYREVSITTIDGDLIEGVARDVNDKSIIMSRNDNWKNKFKIDFSNINNLKVSEFPYFSMEHKRDLREKKIPRSSFRYTKAQLQSLLGKYAFINYDGKIIDGRIIDTVYRVDEPSFITVESIKTGEQKSIFDYRLRELEITGDNLSSHRFSQKLKDIESELFVEIDEYNLNDTSLPEVKVDPDSLINEYFQAKLNVLKGIGIDLDDYDYVWTHEVISSHKKGNMKLNGELKQAREIDKYYQNKKDFVDYIIDKVKSTDWTKYSKKQIDGEVETLEYIYESGIFG